jgi:membrane protein YqaA with SNARE-associated domain
MLITLFFAAFLSATVFPFASEALLIAALEKGADPFIYGLVATLGNSLGAMAMYGVARLARAGRFFKWKNNSKRAELWYQKYGLYTLLLSWMPGIGDFFPALAGWFKAPIFWTVVLVVIAKAGRYTVLIYGYYAVVSYGV